MSIECMHLLHNIMHANHHTNQKILTHLRQENLANIVGNGEDLSIAKDFRPHNVKKTKKYKKNQRVLRLFAIFHFLQVILICTDLLIYMNINVVVKKCIN